MSESSATVIPAGQLVLSDVGNTGLLTAYCHAIESRSPSPLLVDPRAEAIAARLSPLLAESPDPFLRRLARGRLPGNLVVHIALRARKYDDYARDFACRHPGGTVVNLGCGLDTRFWRIDDGRLRLVDLDLPDTIALKRQLVSETERYRLVGQSVFERQWLTELAAAQPGPCLFLAEGLFMYLPPDEVRALVLALQAHCPGSELVFETVNSTWLRPALRWLIDVKLRQQLGLGKEAKFLFGIRDGHEPETWGPGIRLLEEWSYFDEDEPRIGVIRWFRHLRLLRFTQWTVRYLLG